MVVASARLAHVVRAFAAQQRVRAARGVDEVRARAAVEVVVGVLTGSRGVLVPRVHDEVVPTPALDPVPAALADEVVVALGAEDPVGVHRAEHLHRRPLGARGRWHDDDVRALADRGAGDEVQRDARGRVGQVEGVGGVVVAGDDGVGAEVDEVVARPGHQRVASPARGRVLEPRDQPVVAAEEPVRARAADHDVGARVAAHDVVPATAVDGVLAVEAGDHVVPGRPGELVVPVGPHDGGRAPVTGGDGRVAGRRPGREDAPPGRRPRPVVVRASSSPSLESAPAGVRTQTVRFLRPLPLPVGIPGRRPGSQVRGTSCERRRRARRPRGRGRAARRSGRSRAAAPAPRRPRPRARPPRRSRAAGRVRRCGWGA